MVRHPHGSEGFGTAVSFSLEVWEAARYTSHLNRVPVYKHGFLSDEICDLYLYVLPRLWQSIVLKHYDKEIHGSIACGGPLDSGGPRKPQALGSSQPYHVSVHMIHDDLILIWSLAKVCKSRPLAYYILLQHPAKICNQIVSMQSCCRSEAIWWIKKWANWWLEAIHTPSNEMINQYRSMIF